MYLKTIEQQRAVWRISELEEILSQIEDSVEKSLQENPFTAQQDIKYVAVTILQKSLITTREIICLVCAGFPDGALSLARNLYEQFIIVSFFCTKGHGKELQNCIDDYFLSAYMSVLRYNQDTLKINATSEEDARYINEKIKNVKTKLHSKVKGDYAWAGVNSFYSLVKLVQEYNKSDVNYSRFLKIQHLNYKNACTSLHAGALGNIERLGNNDINMIDVGPHPEYCGYPLYFTICSLIGIVGEILQILEIDNKHIVIVLNELAKYYQQSEQ